MIEYIQLRYHCEPCGIFHSVVGQADGIMVEAWVCPACRRQLDATDGCLGWAANPAFGFTFTYRIKQPEAISLMPENRRGELRLSKRSRRAGWDTRRANAGA